VYVDPEGFLYYNKKADFEKDSCTNHTYHVSKSTLDGKTYAVIEFGHFTNSAAYGKVSTLPSPCSPCPLILS
jgi:hypothetical protein